MAQETSVPPAELSDFVMWADGSSPSWRTDPPFPGDRLGRPAVWHYWCDARRAWADAYGWPGGRGNMAADEAKAAEALGAVQAVEAFPDVETTGFARWLSCAHCGDAIDYGVPRSDPMGFKVDQDHAGNAIPSHLGCVPSERPTRPRSTGRRLGVW